MQTTAKYPALLGLDLHGDVLGHVLKKILLVQSPLELAKLSVPKKMKTTTAPAARSATLYTDGRFE
jgi:hypothetical protein